MRILLETSRLHGLRDVEDISGAEGLASHQAPSLLPKFAFPSLLPKFAFLLMAGIPRGTGMSQAISLSQERRRVLLGYVKSKKEGSKSQ